MKISYKDQLQEKSWDANEKEEEIKIENVIDDIGKGVAESAEIIVDHS